MRLKYGSLRALLNEVSFELNRDVVEDVQHINVAELDAVLRRVRVAVQRKAEKDGLIHRLYMCS